MRVTIRVRPGSGRTIVGGRHEQSVVVRVREHAGEGKATAAALVALAKPSTSARTTSSLSAGRGAGRRSWTSRTPSRRGSRIFAIPSACPRPLRADTDQAGAADSEDGAAHEVVPTAGQARTITNRFASNGRFCRRVCGRADVGTALGFASWDQDRGTSASASTGQPVRCTTSLQIRSTCPRGRPASLAPGLSMTGSIGSRSPRWGVSR